MLFFETTSTVGDFLAGKRADGYGVALIDPQGHILTPYLDLGDYPGLEDAPVAFTGADACITQPGPLHLHALVLHGGQLELDYQHQQPYRPLAA